MLAVRLDILEKGFIVRSANQKPCSCKSSVTDNSVSYKKDQGWYNVPIALPVRSAFRSFFVDTGKTLKLP